MSAWLTKFAPALFAILRKAISSLGFLFGLMLGRRTQREDDQRESIKRLRKGADAGANTPLDDDSLRNDPANRDR